MLYSPGFILPYRVIFINLSRGIRRIDFVILMKPMIFLSRWLSTMFQGKDLGNETVTIL